LAVAAHVPDAGGAGRTGHRVRPAHDAGDEVTLAKATAVGRLLDATEGFVTEDQPLLAGRRPAIVASDDLAVGAADAKRQRADQHRTVAWRRLRDGLELNGIRKSRLDGKRTHAVTISR